MNILICGKNNQYLKTLAERLKREKNEIHYISGSKASERVGSSVFQQFDFEYTNPNIGRVVNNAMPDVMVLFGANDRNYTWNNPADDAMTFVSGMSSLIMAAKGAGVKKIIFISSISVLDTHKEALDRTITTSEIATMNDAFLYVESLLGNLSDEDLETVILRLPFDTGIYDTAVSGDYCLNTARSYLEGNKVFYIPDCPHVVMYYLDSIDAIIKTVNYDKVKEKNILNLQGVVFTEEAFVDALVKTELNKKCKAERNAEKDFQPSAFARLETSDEERLGFSTRFGVKEIADRLCWVCLSEQREERSKKQRRMQILPFLESLVAAVIVTLIMYFLRKTWVGDSFSLFTLYTLLFGAVYGTTYGLFSGLLATVGVLIIQWNDVGLLHTLENYAFFLVFLQLILIGVIAGYVRDKFVRKTTTLTEERNYLAQEVHDLTRISDNNTYVKNVYEKRLIAYENSLPRLYELTSQLDYMEPVKVIFHATLVTKKLLEVEDVAIYLSNHGLDYFRLSGANSDRALSIGKSLKYDESSFLYAPFELHEVYKNTTMDETKPSFAAAVWNGDRINAIIMVWTQDLHKVNQYECDMLAIVCRLIEKSMTRAEMYERMASKGSYVEGTRIKTEEAFLQRFQSYTEGERLGVFQFSLLRLESEKFALDAQHLTRDTDVLGIANEALYLMLPFTGREETEHVIDRFAQNGITVVPADREELEVHIQQQPNAEGVEEEL